MIDDLPTGPTARHPTVEDHPRVLGRAGRASGRGKAWRAGPPEAGNVIIMFFQTPIYE
ncbi:hypothetical protein ACFRH6_12525 [Streptomyces sp. NPDC056749]|uniref:hypothetical protein n=1 Tax=Streptomyces sp. NPDC056749 TaxID=3345936 RepID=UPI0036A18DE1